MAPKQLAERPSATSYSLRSFGRTKSFPSFNMEDVEDRIFMANILPSIVSGFEIKNEGFTINRVFSTNNITCSPKIKLLIII